MATVDKADLVSDISDLIAGGASEYYPYAIRRIRDVLTDSGPLTLMDRLRGIEDVLDALDEACERGGVEKP